MEQAKKKEKAGRKLTKKSIASWIVYIAGVSLLLFFIISQLLPPAVGIRMVGFKTFLIADTKSMEPMLTKNDLVFVVNSDFDSLEEGDVITFVGRVLQGGRWVDAPITHKIIEVVIDEEGERSYRTQGVNHVTNPTPDGRLVTKDGEGNTNQYIGKLAFKSHFLGMTVAFFRSPFGIVAIVVNVIIIVLIVLLFKKQPDEEDEESKKEKA